MRRAEESKYDRRAHRTCSVPVLVGLVCAFSASVPGLAGSTQVPQALYQELRWRMIGPFRAGR